MKKFEIVSGQNTPGSPDSPVIITLGSLDPLVCLSPESFFVFFCKTVLMVVQSMYVHQEVDSLLYSSQGSPDSPMYSPPQVETLWCIHHWGVETPWVFMIGESFWMLIYVLKNCLTLGILIDSQCTLRQGDDNEYK